ncbi:hypothetical protein [Flavobacterium sandaracinum]|uniref:XRE family transcriptional regulator n=1 Tax=Flavobacterium sandaracinum TaxID=2541733 RepID=A0A4R5D5X1_9FLAO|nr:hypothetical protein [Flavobacterium sandaracinum]TDE05825.1 hypothetical protein E0F91_06430 [Flavobacterium sandaracinum]
MKTEKELIPKMKFGIIYFIQEQRNNRNWSNDLLLEKLEISQKELDKVMENKEPIAASFAKKLSIIFSTSAEYWINIDKNYRNWLINSGNY